MKVVNIRLTLAIMKNVVEFPQLIERGCGLDVHQQTVVATIKGSGIKEETRTFGTFTGELHLLAHWLKGTRSLI